MTQLTEWSASAPLELTAAQRRSLEQVFKAQITAADGAGDRFIVRPGGVVGSVEIDGTHIVVSPKLRIDRVLFMVAYAADPYRWRQTWSSLGAVDDLVDGMAALFVRVARAAVAQGLLRSYRRVEQDQTVVRGRILWNRQARRIAPIPIAVRFDVHDDDIVENQLVRAALAVLRQVGVRNPSTRSEIARLWRAFEHVGTLRQPLLRLDQLVRTRQNAHYWPVLGLVRVVLDGQMAEVRAGRVPVPGFTLALDQVFEQFVRVAVRHSAGLSEETMPDSWAGRGLYLAESSRLQLKPDLGARDGGRWLFVGDVKYRRDSGAGSIDDIYQVHAYATATGLPSASLIYAEGPPVPVAYQVVRGGPRVHLHHLDLTCGPDDLLQQLAVVSRAMTPSHQDAA